MIIIFPLILIFEITDSKPSGILDYLDYMFWATALLGVFGYCYEKKIANKKFWKVYLPVVVIWDLFIGNRDIQNYPELSGTIYLFFATIIIFIIILPEYIGLYLYGYRENE